MEAYAFGIESGSRAMHCILLSIEFLEKPNSIVNRPKNATRGQDPCQLLTSQSILQSLMNAKLCQYRFWLWYENGTVKAIPMIPHNQVCIYEFQVSFPLLWIKELIHLHRNP